MIRVTDGIQIDEEEIAYSFLTAQGPGGQHVNRAATAVQLRFDAAGSPSLPGEAIRRLRSVAGRRMTADGVVIIRAQRYRSQDRNRQDALDRLVKLIQRAAEPPRPRRTTRPSPAAKAKRLDEKARRGAIKRGRGPVQPDE